MTTKTRIYDSSVDIDFSSVQEFWQARSNQHNLHSVLLGNPEDQDAMRLRNEQDCSIFRDNIPIIKGAKVLEIGCGMGRWVGNFGQDFSLYHGFDFSSGYVEQATKNFQHYPHCSFYQMPITDISKENCPESYNLIIITCVLQYVNDEVLPNFFKTLQTLSLKPCYFYFQEPVSIMPHRMTLKDFYSDELKADYNSIYRTQEEYEALLKNMSDFSILKTDLLLNEKNGARQETNARYWILYKDNT